MRINAFFELRLGARLANPVWSWGAHDEQRNRVFLRTNENHLSQKRGKKRIIAYDPNWRRSPGHGERLRHLEAVRRGATGYAVMVRFNDQGNIASFDAETLLELGDLQKEGRLIYARVVRQLDATEVTGGPSNSNSVADDVTEVLRSKAVETTRRALVDARMGQGRFRQDVLRLWGGACAVTGVNIPEVLRASHIKPWRDASNKERLDPANGLPLVATLDALFDAGLIAFDSKRKLLVSPKLPADDAAGLGVRGLRLRRMPDKKTARYLEFHRRRLFRS